MSGPSTKRPQEHAPKVAALLADAAGLLSEAGSARLQRHVRHCATCQRRARSIALHDADVREARALPLPALDWERVLAGVDARTRSQSEPAPGDVQRLQAPASRPTGSRQSPARVWMGGLALAACALLAYLTLPRRPADHPSTAPKAQATAPEARAPAQPARSVAVKPVALATQVVAVQGHVVLTPVSTGVPEPLDPMRPLSQGDVLSVQGVGLVDLAIEGGGRARLASDTTAALASLTSQLVSLDLAQGTVTERVPPQKAGARYQVQTGGLRVVVRGTHFAVTRADGQTLVGLAEGSVDVLDANGQRVARLIAPASWHSGAPVAAQHGVIRDPTSPAPSLPVPYGGELAELSAAPLLQLPELTTVRAWRLGDVAFDAPGELRMRVPSGPLELQALLRDGREVPVSLEVAPEGLTLTAARLAQLVPALAPPPKMGHLEPEQLMAVVHAKRPALQRCYELALRRTPTLQPRVSMRITLSPDGGVRRVHVGDGDAPPQLVECIDRVATRWRFPNPHGPLTFDLPLRFRARHP